MKKKVFLVVLAMVVSIVYLAGCRQKTAENESAGRSDSTNSGANDAEGNTLPQESGDSSRNESSEQQVTEGDGTPAVYFTSDISPDGLAAVYEKLNWRPSGKVAVKLSTGEPPASNYLRPELIQNLVNIDD